MLTIMLSQNTDGSFLHYILAPASLDIDIAHAFLLALEARDMAVTYITPDEEICGCPAQQYQWVFWARENLTAWLREQFDNAVAVVAADITQEGSNNNA